MLALACVCAAASDRVTRVGGEEVEDDVVAIQGGQLTLSRGALAVDEVWRVSRSPVSPVVETGTGAVERIILYHGELMASRVAFDGGVCRFGWQGLSEVVLPRAAIRALVFPAGDTPAVRDTVVRAIERPSAADQVLALGADNLPVPVAGAIVGIATNAVAISYRGQERSIARGRVCAVVFGTNGIAVQVGSLPWKVTMTDGAWIEGVNAGLSNGVLTLDIGSGALGIPWDRVVRLECRGRRLRYLSELDPVAVAQDAIVTLPFVWQRNRNVMGQPLRIQGEIFDRGLGMHAPAELVFDLPGNARRFLAVVGLDGEYGRKGDCVVTVQAGGRELFRRRLRGVDAPQPVDVEVRDAGRLVLRVEAGEGLDIGDHVNWCDARLLVEP
jgi:hypothetical protein